MTEQIRLVAGLGNPGRKYSDTRHNVGFRVLAELAQRYHVRSTRSKFQGEYADVMIAERRALLLCPQTYMNKSGASVLAARDFYKLDHRDLLIVCDDFNLPLGRVRIRPGGSAGGQKGLDDVIRRLGSDGIPRLRIGIDAPPEGWDVAAYVLSKFRSEESDAVELAVRRAADAAVCWVRDGIDACMNQFNGL